MSSAAFEISDYAAPKIITSDAQHRKYTAHLIALERKERSTPSDRAYANLLAVLIEAYEAKRYPIADASPLDVLKELMAANNLRAKDLAELLGGESVVSLVLRGKRPLNRGQIERLSARFRISPAAFFRKVVTR